ncbi:acetyl-CoA carboxylase biotin carboxyl carrier protein [Prauserella flava]|nr:acetyl-CoA carboxylase biotin carboxyl carrier protein [Prauserella flava]MCR3735939.1 acetyl-CoA carboxylase biotin carboxyl carrier protein [Prauserella salsuginis]
MSHQPLSPTASSVWKIVKSAGASVSAGDEIVILESMKMEIPVTAEADGIITKIFVEEGQAVDEDDPIAEIE